MCGTKIIVSKHGCHTSFEYTPMMQIGTFASIPFCWTQQKDLWSFSLPWLTLISKHFFFMQLKLIWISIYMSFTPCSFYFYLMCRSIELDHVKPSLVRMISLKSKALEKFPYGNSRMLYPLTYIRSARINLIRLGIHWQWRHFLNTCTR
jgi:hypothetical protein